MIERDTFEGFRDDPPTEYGLEGAVLVASRAWAHPVLVVRRTRSCVLGLTFNVTNGKIVLRSFPPMSSTDLAKATIPSKRGVPSLVKLFCATVDRNTDTLTVDDEFLRLVTSGSDRHTLYLVDWAATQGTGVFAARVASSIRTTEAALMLLEQVPTVPLIVRVALLPLFGAHVALVQDVLTRAHSRNWTDAQGDNNVAERLATAAAYVYADHTHRVVDDPHGRNVIRERRVVGELMRRGTMPWVSRMEHPEDHK